MHPICKANGQINHASVLLSRPPISIFMQTLCNACVNFGMLLHNSFNIRSTLDV
uniref:Pentatricopeptide repeat-containing protein At3g63370ic-like n=1 Tax=Rhizophora mucronata TaxID=61149 RepID=A0A2P2IPE9_RHIMU